MTKAERIKALIDNPKTSFTADDTKYLEGLSDDRLKAAENVAALLKTENEVKAASDKTAADAKLAAETAAKVASDAKDKEIADLKAAADSTTEAKDKEITDLKAAAAKAPTEEEWLKAAPPSIKTLVESKKAEDAARKDSLVTALKAATTAYTEDELKAMELGSLEKLAVALKVGQPRVDFSGQAPRASTDRTAPPAPVDFNKRLREQKSA